MQISDILYLWQGEIIILLLISTRVFKSYLNSLLISSCPCWEGTERHGSRGRHLHRRSPPVSEESIPYDGRREAAPCEPQAGSTNEKVCTMHVCVCARIHQLLVLHNRDRMCTSTLVLVTWKINFRGEKSLCSRSSEVTDVCVCFTKLFYQLLDISCMSWETNYWAVYEIWKDSNYTCRWLTVLWVASSFAWSWASWVGFGNNLHQRHERKTMK